MTLVGFVGDSYLQTGSGRTPPLQTTCAARLGWTLVLSSQPGTGYLNPGAFTKYRDRIAADLYPSAPSIVVVTGGLNDATAAFPAAQIRAEAALLYADIRANLPKAQLIVLTPFNPLPNGWQNLIDIRTGVLAAAKAANAQLIDIWNPFWITGTGNVGTPNGSGNSDVYTQADNTHPTQPGSDYLGMRLAFAISPPNTGLPALA